MKERAGEIVLNPMYNGYQGGLAKMVFDQKIGSGAIAISKTRANVNEVLAQELRKPMIKTGVVNESKGKPNKFWVDQKREFYNNLIQK